MEKMLENGKFPDISGAPRENLRAPQKKQKNAPVNPGACGGPDRTATHPMVNQYQMLFFMDRTNSLTTWLGGS